MEKKKVSCESCGNKKYVRNRYGKLLCSTCQTLWSSINNHPQVCCAAYKHFYGADLPATAADGAVGAELEYYVELIDQVSQALGSVEAKDMVAAVEGLVATSRSMASAAGKARDEAESLRAENGRLSMKLDQAKADVQGGATACDPWHCDELQSAIKELMAVNAALGRHAPGAGSKGGVAAAVAMVVAELERLEYAGGKYQPRPGYESVLRVLLAAYEQASRGKGHERHGTPEPFERQPSCHDARLLGLGYPLGQARKKALEAMRLTGEARLRELLGAIVYLVIAHIVASEELSRCAAAEEGPGIGYGEGGGHD